ncbi:unnamed protein product [Trichogramma brassicae]|uniref:Uncharacterized protein n=1 Tax=Trichogramma brassicae TaxID=86971 RepID=A0A6H5IPD2_9HYME|nr:unnamed protein product [Trichogramma brassicae]
MRTEPRRTRIVLRVQHQASKRLEQFTISTIRGYVPSFYRYSQLKNLHKKFNWDNERERAKFLRQFSTLVVNWNGRFPNLRDIFRKEEIDRLLAESVKSDDKAILSDAIIEFVINTGYEDEPDMDEDGKLVSRRTTAIHYADKFDCFMAAFKLFKIYNRFDVNYSDESGYTHFHAACEAGLDEFVEKFLEHGHDPNCLVTETGDSPLHLTPAASFIIMKKKIVQKLLESGANPNLVNKDGLTPLHVLCKTPRKL